MVHISEKDCHIVMDEVVKGKKYNIKEYAVEPFAEVMGFHGSHALLRIKATVGGKEKEFVFFVKFATKSQAVFDRYVGKMKMFLKEHIVITKLMKQLQAQVGKRLTSECYLSRLDKFMVLENLNDLKYEVIRRKEGLDFKHAKVAVKTFAEFHASSILLEESGVSIPDKYPDAIKESFFIIPDDVETDEHLILSCHRSLSAWADKMTPHIPSNVREKTFNTIYRRVFELIKSSNKYRNVLCHGDPWGSNIMYRYNGSDPIEGILVDFQGVRYTPPTVDLMQFMYIAADKDLRETYGSELKEIYYRHLGETLSSHGVELDSIMTMDEYRESLEHYREYGVCCRLYYTFITRIPLKYLAPAVSDVEVFLGLMVGSDPKIPLEAADDPVYREGVVSAIEAACNFYTGYTSRVSKEL